MSHFSNIKTKIRNVESLTAALTDLGIEWKTGPQPVRGYRGDTRTAAVVIQQENGYDIGFSDNGNHEYELIADLQFWEQNWSVDRFLNQITQRYAYHTVLTEATKQGFQVVEECDRQDGSIKLVVQRWNA
ncbi:DUF1257 domain-containing protein [Chamaesiphon sp. VAR_69_metabat_338]|uniref:DUF1257 domain-containing protein n=1 Tax=Chamaesiphon sp. VAR_69_metabat_338 TaxID=2964704 RepID=UPI00286D6BC3|nr:DUF1257 domain-containing protein [Chamaesiphon sp. VAR_69_metabat_338]